MIANFVLIKTRPGQECDVYDELKYLPEIIEFHQLFGEYDLIIKVKAEDLNELSKIVVNKIRHIEGVIDTKTLPGIKF